MDFELCRIENEPSILACPPYFKLTPAVLLLLLLLLLLLVLQLA